MTDVLVVPRYMSVVQVGNDVLVGALPPRAVAIQNAPTYVSDLLASLSVPHSRPDALTLAMQCGDLSYEQSAQLLDELIEAGVLSTRDIRADGRYARHAL